MLKAGLFFFIPLARATIGSAIGGILVIALLISFLNSNNSSQFRKNLAEETRNQIGEHVANQINGEVVPKLVENTCQISDIGCGISISVQSNLSIILVVAGIVSTVIIALLVYQKIIPLLP